MGVLYANVNGVWEAVVGGSAGAAPVEEVVVSTTDPGAANYELWYDPDATPTGGGGGGLDQATADTLYVNVTGDTVTGDLTLNDPAVLWFGPGRGSIAATATDFSINNPQAAGTTTVRTNSGDGGAVRLAPAGDMVASVLPTLVLIGKTATAASSEGIEAGITGRFNTCTAAANSYNIVANIIAAVSGNRFADWRRDSTSVGSVNMSGTTGVAYATTSDYRLKDELGAVATPVERVKQIRPIHFAWKADGTEQDGFLAHELAAVVPDAVIGDKDAVATPGDVAGGRAIGEGDIVPQQADISRLVPLLTAALQEVVARLEALEGAV